MGVCSRLFRGQSVFLSQRLTRLQQPGPGSGPLAEAGGGWGKAGPGKKALTLSSLEPGGRTVRPHPHPPEAFITGTQRQGAGGWKCLTGSLWTQSGSVRGRAGMA